MNWYDNASLGFTADTVHVFNSTSSTQSVSVLLAGSPPKTNNSLAAGGEWYTWFSPAQTGGPIAISPAGQLASRRTQFNSSFNETNAVAGGAWDQFLPWLDKVSGHGFCTDTLHIANPSSVDANVAIGFSGQLITNTIHAGREWIWSPAAGALGGPIEVKSDEPVVASERIQYMHSFNETNAIPTTSRSRMIYFPWYDSYNQEFRTDDIHVVNPDPNNPCVVNVSLPGSGTHSLILSPLSDGYTSFTAALGGPVQVLVTNDLSICPGVMAYQRVNYNGSFSEADGMPQSAAYSSWTFNWYDDRSGVGFVSDDIHVVNPGAIAATVSVSLPGASTVRLIIPAGADGHANFPGQLGGPVRISSDQPVLASERVQYFSSFHEVDALGNP